MGFNSGFKGLNSRLGYRTDRYTILQDKVSCVTRSEVLWVMCIKDTCGELWPRPVSGDTNSTVNHAYTLNKLSCESFDGASTLEGFGSMQREINTAKLKYINSECKADKLTEIQEVLGNIGARCKTLRLKQLQIICLKFSRFILKQAYVCVRKCDERKTRLTV